MHIGHEVFRSEPGIIGHDLGGSHRSDLRLAQCENAFIAFAETDQRIGLAAHHVGDNRPENGEVHIQFADGFIPGVVDTIDVRIGRGDIHFGVLDQHLVGRQQRTEQAFNIRFIAGIERAFHAGRKIGPRRAGRSRGVIALVTDLEAAVDHIIHAFDQFRHFLHRGSEFSRFLGTREALKVGQVRRQIVP